MQFNNYPAFRTAVHTLLDGDDISQSDLSVAVLDLIIGAGEVRIYRELRSSVQDLALSLTVNSNVAILPPDFLELKSLYSPTYVPATFAPYEAVQGLIQTAARLSPGALRYTFEGDTIIFYPSMDAVTISGRYYARLPDIALGVNALLIRHPDLFLYAALAESAPFLGEDDRLQIWSAKYDSIVQAANEQERRRTSRGSKLQTRIA